MEDLKNKVFLVKIPKELFEYLKDSKESSDNKVGELKVFLNKKRKKPEFNLIFNKENGPKKFSLNFNKTNDYFYFYDQEKKEDMKIYNIDNFGKLIIKDKEESDKLIENIFRRESNKSKDIAVKQVKDVENKYTPSKEIQLTDKKYVNKDKKEKRVRKDQNEVENYIIDIVSKNKYITPKEIADALDIPENQAKDTLNKLCDLYMDHTIRKKFYKLKNEEL